jgi:N-glycosidase YbiA
MERIDFYRASEEYGEFSNFSPHGVFLDGKRWPTSEHYFQAQKFHDVKHREEVRRARTPMIAAQLGRDRRKKLRPDWESVKDGIMTTAVRAKFTQHKELTELLLSTGDALLVEHTANDSYWGDGGDGHGRNRLGQILMQVRAELREQAQR